ncbi:hypothetical protein [uncultured Campylobacter sp.]|mgnify:FL=1|jgi:hypothetical protein|uniref:hypothetical protein n=1 Tax=uncultured Campylobacter sp. TaxID=218934 RepID=UPI002616639C|nr:hypothetical protein [uncultured Campylobacter sp.]
MATENYDRKCKELVDDIRNGVSQIRLGLTNFLIEFVEFDENSDDESYLKKRAKSYEKLMQRVKNENLSSQKMADKLKAIYKFLLDSDEYKKLKRYKTLIDDSFERKILGDEICENIQEGSKIAFGDTNEPSDT